jgi:hypothetical protein
MDPTWPVENSILARASRDSENVRNKVRGAEAGLDAAAHLMVLGHNGCNFPESWATETWPSKNK